MLKKLEEWKDKGMKDSGNFSMDSNYDEIEDEYEGAMEEKRRKDRSNFKDGGYDFINSLSMQLFNHLI